MSTVVRPPLSVGREALNSDVGVGAGVAVPEGVDVPVTVGVTVGVGVAVCALAVDATSTTDSARNPANRFASVVSRPSTAGGV